MLAEPIQMKCCYSRCNSPRSVTDIYDISAYMKASEEEVVNNNRFQTKAIISCNIDNDTKIWVTSIKDLDISPSSLPQSRKVSTAEVDTHGNSSQDDLVRTIMSKLSNTEKEKICRFYFEADRKRALLSLLMQKQIICDEFGTSTEQFHILRTREGKPYLSMTNREMLHGKYSWNFNASHHGDYVCIASHPHHLIGVDIVDLNTSIGMATSTEEFFSMFRQQLTATELDHILSRGSEEEQLTLFFLYWNVKEAFIKAVGKGLGYDLQTAEFHIELIEGSTLQRSQNKSAEFRATASLKLNGIKRDDWRFDMFGIDHYQINYRGDDTVRHVMCLARGPIDAATDSYQQSVGMQTTKSQFEVQESLKLSLPSPKYKTLLELSRCEL